MKTPVLHYVSFEYVPGNRRRVCCGEVQQDSIAVTLLNYNLLQGSGRASAAADEQPADEPKADPEAADQGEANPPAPARGSQEPAQPDPDQPQSAQSGDRPAKPSSELAEPGGKPPGEDAAKKPVGSGEVSAPPPGDQDHEPTPEEVRV